MSILNNVPVMASKPVAKITTSAILQYVRRGKVKEIHDFGDERGEIMEIEILATTKFADKKIADLTIPNGVVIGGIVRKKKLIFPDEETIILVKTEGLPGPETVNRFGKPEEANPK